MMWTRATMRADDPNLVSCAGLAPVMTLAEQAGLSELVDEKVQITNAPIPSTGANPPAKIPAIVAGMATGADSIEDLDAIRHGGMKRLFAGKRGARFGSAKAGGYSLLLRGLSPLVATIATPLATPVIAAVRLRGAASTIWQILHDAGTGWQCGQ